MSFSVASSFLDHPVSFILNAILCESDLHDEILLEKTVGVRPESNINMGSCLCKEYVADIVYSCESRLGQVTSAKMIVVLRDFDLKAMVLIVPTRLSIN